MGPEQYGSSKGYVHFITRVEEDTVDANVYYVGNARPRTAAATAAWRIQKIVLAGAGSSSPGDTSLTVFWANGDDRFEHVWDDRQSLSYT
jgi:hypothetical protein